MNYDPIFPTTTGILRKLGGDKFAETIVPIDPKYLYKEIDLTTLSAVINGATKTVSNALLETAVASLQSGGTPKLVTFEDVGGAFKRQASTTRFIMLKQDVNGVLVNYPAVASTANGVATSLTVCGVLKLDALFFRCDVCISFGLNGDVGEILVIATPINT